MPHGLKTLFGSLAELKDSWGHLLTGGLLVVAAYVVLVQTAPPVPLASGIIAIVNGYLALMLWCTASLSAGRGELWPYLPNRKAACLLLPLLLFAQVLAFAAIYVGHVQAGNATIREPSVAAYRSFLNLTTLTYDGVLNSANGDRIAFWQVVSGLLLIICAFPLLVSRLSMFGGAGLRRIEFNGCPIFLPDSEEAKASMTRNEFKWDLPGVALVTATLDANGKRRNKRSEAAEE
jgi:hypothetical protein